MDLVTRFCKCGCGNHFKCFETSGQRYMSKFHLYVDSHVKNKSKKNIDQKAQNEKSANSPGENPQH